MQLKILCSAHGQWVFFYSQTALSQLDNMQKEKFLLDRLTLLSTFIANTFHQLGMRRNGQVTLAQIQKRLQDVATRAFTHKRRLSYIQRYIFAIKNCIKNINLYLRKMRKTVMSPK